MNLTSYRPNAGARARFTLLLALVFVATSGATVSDLNEAGTAAYARGDYTAAERLFTQALAQAPNEPLLHYQRGVALMRLSRWQEASAAFETTLRLNPPLAMAAAAKEGIRSLAPLVRAPAAKTRKGDDVWITLRRLGGGWMAAVRLNDSHTANFLVDTGASFCVISPELAGALSIEPGPRAESVTLQIVGGRTTGPIVKIASVRVGDAEAEDVTAVIHPISPGIDGLLGNSFLARFTVTLDPQQGTLHLRPR